MGTPTLALATRCHRERGAWWLLALVGACVLQSPPVASQVPSVERAACPSVLLEARPGRPFESTRRALADVIECPQSGPPALAALWDSRPSDASLLSTLSNASAGLRDMRVLLAVIRTAENSTLPRRMRLAALRTLLRLYDPARVVEFRTRPEDGPEGHVFAGFGEWSHPPGRDGASPITAAGRDAILATLRRMGNADADPEIKRVSTLIEREVKPRS
jgi:hypothetical protein